MNIDDLKYSEIKEIQRLFNNNQNQESPWKLGKNYFIRTVTMHLTGKLIFISDKELVLDDASWIADSGRFHDALKTGKLNEVEPFVNEIIINRGSIIDATIWNHLLPNEQI